MVDRMKYEDFLKVDGLGELECERCGKVIVKQDLGVEGLDLYMGIPDDTVQILCLHCITRKEAEANALDFDEIQRFIK